MGPLDGVGLAAQLDPTGLDIDAAGNMYIGDVNSNRIRKITPSAVVTTLAGGGGGSTMSGYADGVGTAATFNSPYGTAVDTLGTVYVADAGNNKIRKVASSGAVSTVAGSPTGTSGSADGFGTNAMFLVPWGVCVTTGGKLFVADAGNRKIRQVLTSGLVTTFAGSGNTGGVDGVGDAAAFYEPHDIRVDPQGILYVADYYVVRTISPGAVVTTLAGSTVSGSADGVGTSAQFGVTMGIAVRNGWVYVTEWSNNALRLVSPGGGVTTLAGGTTGKSFADGYGTNANFNTPAAIALSAEGTIFVNDNGNL
jgi:hypothetical protein